MDLSVYILLVPLCTSAVSFLFNKSKFSKLKALVPSPVPSYPFLSCPTFLSPQPATNPTWVWKNCPVWMSSPATRCLKSPARKSRAPKPPQSVWSGHPVFWARWPSSKRREVWVRGCRMKIWTAFIMRSRKALRPARKNRVRDLAWRTAMILGSDKWGIVKCKGRGWASPREDPETY